MTKFYKPIRHTITNIILLLILGVIALLTVSVWYGVWWMIGNIVGLVW